jgi:hypothetical protein
MEKTTVYLPIALKSELKILSRRANQSEAETIREALSQYVEQKREPRRLPKSLGMVSDGSFDAANYEDYLDEHWKPDW